MEKPWYVYILRCSHTYLYTGISPDVEKRLLAHREKRGAKFTKNKSPIELVYIEKHENSSAAAKREYAIKQLKKHEKEVLIQEFSTLHDLSSNNSEKDILALTH